MTLIPDPATPVLPPGEHAIHDPQAFFRAYTALVPTPLAIREAIRMAALLPLLREPKEVLDVGCGDGTFWLLCPVRALHQVDGIDLSPKETDIARKRGVFRTLTIGDITQDPPQEAAYDLILGNCSLEHIPDIQTALSHMARGLRPGGKVVLFVPAPQWTRSLGLVKGLSKIGHRLGMSLGLALDGFFQHHHLYSHRIWSLLLKDAGFSDIQAMGLGGPSLNRKFSRHLPLAFLEFLWKAPTGRYPGWRFLRSRHLSASAMAEVASPPLDPDSDHAVEYFLVGTLPGPEHA